MNFVNENFIKSKIRTIPNYPKEGIMFRDITTLLADKEGLMHTANMFYEKYKDYSIHKVVGVEARGFTIGSIIALKLNCGFVPIRKKGKLPFNTISEEYKLEYGFDTVEIHKDAILEGEKVLLVDDLIATGGTLTASINLIHRLKGTISSIGSIVDLVDLKGSKKIKEDYNIEIFSLCEFEGD